MNTAWIRTFACAFALVALAACQTAPSKPDETGAAPPAAAPVLGEGYADLASGGKGVVHRIDPAKSMVRLYVFRGGAAAKAGHNHVFAVPKFEGLAFVPTGDPSSARFDVRVRLEDLTLDDPAWREATGEAFAGERSASDIEGTKKNMLGPKGFDAAQFPEVRLSSAAIHGDWPILVADVAVTLHGVTRQQPVMLEVHHTASEIKVSGTMVLKQTDFGVTPLSVLGGLLAVQNEVAIRFDLVGAPATGE